MRLTPDILDRLGALRHEIIEKCPYCGGTERVDNELCICSQVFVYVSRLITARIPQAYWQLKLDSLKMDPKYLDLVAHYIDRIESAAANGLGFMFLGTNGIGKTALMCEIGKSAIALEYSVQYFTAQQYVDAKNDRSLLYKTYESPKFVLLDEIDKVYIKPETKFAVKALEEFIRRSLSENKCMIICTNLDQGEFKRIFGDSIMSMLKRNMRLVDVVGDDFSEKLHDRWAEKLNNESYDYYHESIYEKAHKLALTILKESVTDGETTESSKQDK